MNRTDYDSVIVDSMNLAFRSWWPCKDLKASSGLHTGLEYGFFKNLLHVARTYIPARVVLAWDGRPSRVLAAYGEYKANRSTENRSEEAPWGPRIAELRAALSRACLSLYEPDSEADEEIARYVRLEELAGRRTLILSNDADLCQLVTDRTHVWVSEGGEPLGEGGVSAKYGVGPGRLVYLRALSGDRSDNIPGIKHLPTAVKVKLAAEAGSPEHFFSLCTEAPYLTESQRKKLVDGKEIIRRNYELMNLRGAATLPTPIAEVTGEVAPALALCARLELASLLERREWLLFGQLAENSLPTEAGDGETLVPGGRSQ